jgi:hypothetical protein
MKREVIDEIKWCNGEKAKKSYKNDKPILNSDNKIIDNIIQSEYNVTNKKDEYNEKMNSRDLMSLTYKNPFLTKDYLDVLDDQRNFLIPKNSSM